MVAYMNRVQKTFRSARHLSCLREYTDNKPSQYVNGHFAVRRPLPFPILEKMEGDPEAHSGGVLAMLSCE
jgi:hypothetical protein